MNFLELMDQGVRIELPTPVPSRLTFLGPFTSELDGCKQNEIIKNTVKEKLRDISTSQTHSTVVDVIYHICVIAGTPVREVEYHVRLSNRDKIVTDPNRCRESASLG